MSEQIFPCTQCGKCCRVVGLSEELKHFDRGDGACKHLEEGSHHCLIYQNRPEICNVQQMYNKHYADQYNWDDFVAVNMEACKQIQNNPHIPWSGNANSSLALIWRHLCGNDLPAFARVNKTNQQERNGNLLPIQTTHNAICQLVGRFVEEVTTHEYTNQCLL